MQDIWNETKDEHQFLAFVFEEKDSYVGRQVCLVILKWHYAQSRDKINSMSNVEKLSV